MNKIAIVYASLTGNTEEIAELIAEGVRIAGAIADLCMVEQTSAIVLEQYDAFLLGTYTWGDGDVPDEFADFIDEMDEIDVTHAVAAVFGSGDTSYDYFCGAVDQLEDTIRRQGIPLVCDGLKIEYGPSSEEEKQMCRKFGITIMEYLNKA